MPIGPDILKTVDWSLGRLLCRVLGRRTSGAADASSPGRILVIRPGGIGDAVLFVPMLRHLQSVWPDAEIDLLVERRNAPVIRDTGLAARVFLYDRPFSGLLAIMRRRYDLVIDTEQYHRLSAVVARLTGAPRRVGFGTNDRERMLTDVVSYDRSRYEASMFLELSERATGVDANWDGERPFFPVSESAARFAEERLAEIDTSRAIAIHPGASIPERRWGTERYGALARELSEEGHPIVLLGGKGDVAAARRIAAHVSGPCVDLAGRCDLMQVAALVQRVAVYVSADSGVLHLAYGVGTPTVHLFGPGVLSKWGPPGSRFHSVRVELPCSPCTRYGYTPPCCQGLACMRGIEPAAVAAAVRRGFASRGEQGTEVRTTP